MTEGVWITRGFEGFRRGSFGNGGQNLYVSRGGVLFRWRVDDEIGDLSRLVKAKERRRAGAQERLQNFSAGLQVEADGGFLRDAGRKDDIDRRQARQQGR